ncbi:MAG: glycoside hydrolase family 3 protein [Myxococcota bacterium]
MSGATIFPHNMGLGAANDPELMERIGQATAREILATGVEWTFAPTLAVARDDHWGRTYESYAEDPEIVGVLGAAIIRGLQGGLAGDDGAIIACAKHWVGDGGTHLGFDQGETTLPEETLRALHIAPYYPALAANVLTVMASYNSWNGLKCHGHKYLLTDVLKNEMGFRGFVVSDWNGVEQVAPKYVDAVQLSVNAGVDMYMVPQKWQRHIEIMTQLVENGRIPMARIDDAVRRILRVKLAYGLFDRVRPADRPHSNAASFGGADHRAIAREAVRKSLVLLKNDGGLLPLGKDARILVAGKNADNLGHQCGGFTYAWQGTSGPDKLPGGTSIWTGIQQIAPGAVLSPDGEAAHKDRFDVAIVVIGERPYAEGMGDLRGSEEAATDAIAPGSAPIPPPVAGGSGHIEDEEGTFVWQRMQAYGKVLDLAVNHPEDLEVLNRVTDQGIPVVLVLVSGRPLVMNEAIDQAQAFVAAFLPGTEGAGVADVLFGDHDFQGRLSFSWPVADLDNPNRGDDPDRARYPYGFGLRLSDR